VTKPITNSKDYPMNASPAPALSGLAARVARINAEFETLAKLGWTVTDVTVDGDADTTYEAEHFLSESLVSATVRSEMLEKLQRHPVTMLKMRELASDGWQFSYHEGRRQFEYQYEADKGPMPFETLFSAYAWAEAYFYKPEADHAIPTTIGGADVSSALAEATAAKVPALQVPEGLVGPSLPPEPVPDPVSPSSVQEATPVVVEAAAGVVEEGKPARRRRGKKAEVEYVAVAWSLSVPAELAREITAEMLLEGEYDPHRDGAFPWDHFFERLVPSLPKELRHVVEFEASPQSDGSILARVGGGR